MLDNYYVEEIRCEVGKKFVRDHHYSHGSHNGPSGCYGLFDKDILIGVCLFATPCSENVRSSVFGKEYKQHVAELHRLVILDVTPRNTESWFVSRCLKLYKQKRPHIWAVVSFADGTEGHAGTIYQALNFNYYGVSGKARFYRDVDGRLRHPRQNGVNISVAEATSRGWTIAKREGKHRYVIFLPDDKRHLRQLQQMCVLQYSQYPKGTVRV